MLYNIYIFLLGCMVGFCVARLIISDKRIVDELAIIKFTLDNIFDWVKGSSTKIDFLCIKNGILQELTDEEKKQIEIIEKLKRNMGKN